MDGELEAELEQFKAWKTICFNGGSVVEMERNRREIRPTLQRF